MKMLSIRLGATIALLFAAALPVRAQTSPPPAKQVEYPTFINYFDPAQLVADENQGTIGSVLGDYLIPEDNANYLSLSSLYRLALPNDELFGATLSGISDSLRTQLNIPAGQGVLVSNLRPDGPSATVGLQLNDILLTLSDKPIASSEDLTNLLKAAGETPSTLKLLRGGKPMAIQVRPVYRVTFGWVGEEKKEYFIGVSINPVEDAIRSQLNLPANQGVVVSEVTKGSPAETVGIKQHDILMEIGGKPIDTPENLAALVQAGQDKPTTIKLIRGGKALSISVTPAVRKVELTAAVEATRLYPLIGLARMNRYQSKLLMMEPNTATGQSVDANTLQEQVTQLQQEMKALRETMDKINESLKALAPKK